jgi:hypothetical protein
MSHDMRAGRARLQVQHLLPRAAGQERGANIQVRVELARMRACALLAPVGVCGRDGGAPSAWRVRARACCCAPTRVRPSRPHPDAPHATPCAPHARRVEPDPTGSKDTCILVFSAGPPYEDIAFRVVNKEWETTQRCGAPRRRGGARARRATRAPLGCGLLADAPGCPACPTAALKLTRGGRLLSLTALPPPRVECATTRTQARLQVHV